jgi:hypothetical protein
MANFTTYFLQQISAAILVLIFYTFSPLGILDLITRREATSASEAAEIEKRLMFC